MSCAMDHASGMGLEILTNISIQFSEQLRLIRPLADVSLRRHGLPFEEMLAAAAAITRHLPRTEDEAGEDIPPFADL